MTRNVYTQIHSAGRCDYYAVSLSPIRTIEDVFNHAQHNVLNMKVSIVTPSYNQGEFIEETIQSIKIQDYQNIEHIVVDGGSEDETLDILEEYSDTYDMKFISESDDGQSDAINTGFDIASGDIVTWLNSDDVYFDTKVVSRVVEYFNQSDEDIIYGDICQISKGSEVIRIKPSHDFDVDTLEKECFVPQPATFLAEKVVRNEKLKVSLDYTMDYEYWLRLSDSYSFKYVPDLLAGFRRYDEQKSQSKRLIREREEVFNNIGIYRGTRIPYLIISGAKWRINAVQRSFELVKNPPKLAFDGDIPSIHSLLFNLLLLD